MAPCYAHCSPWFSLSLAALLVLRHSVLVSPRVTRMRDWIYFESANRGHLFGQNEWIIGSQILVSYGPLPENSSRLARQVALTTLGDPTGILPPSYRDSCLRCERWPWSCAAGSLATSAPMRANRAHSPGVGPGSSSCCGREIAG